MKTYPKIDTLFDRGPDFTVDVTRVRRPEFEAIDKWIFTEKVDGTNIRIHFELDPEIDLVIMTLGGRTDRAQLPKELEQRLLTQEEKWITLAREQMDLYSIDSLTLFGEGYGAKIQKGGGNYRAQQSFILFDVLVNNVTWLDENAITATANHFSIERVPTYFIGTRADAINMIRMGFSDGYIGDRDNKLRSLIATHFENFEAEGVVARPLVPLYNNRGQRVMWKLKGSDFRAGKR